MDKEEISEKTQAVLSGSLVNKVKKNMSYSATGIIIGGLTGAMVSGWLGKGKLIGALVGAAALGLGGYLLSNKNEKDGE